jgi:hypothetical protein
MCVCACVCVCVYIYIYICWYKQIIRNTYFYFMSEVHYTSFINKLNWQTHCRTVLNLLANALSKQISRLSVKGVYYNGHKEPFLAYMTTKKVTLSLFAPLRHTGERRGITQLILNLGTRFGRVRNFMLQQLYSRERTLVHTE